MTSQNSKGFDCGQAILLSGAHHCIVSGQALAHGERGAHGPLNFVSLD